MPSVLGQLASPEIVEEDLHHPQHTVPRGVDKPLQLCAFPDAHDEFGNDGGVVVVGDEAALLVVPDLGG